MTSANDTAGASAKARATGQGLRLAGDRAAVRTIARRHSHYVRALKYALPVTALAALGLYGVSIANTVGWSSGIASLEIPNISPENLAMENPHYDGYTSDGGRYWVNAERAQQELPSMSVIKLDVITGELTDSEKAKTRIEATRGVFDTKANVLELFDRISVTGDGGLKADLTRATVKTKEGLITSDEPVKVHMAAGDITANQMTVRQKTKEYTFVEEVRTILRPEKPGEKPGAGDVVTAALPAAAKPAAKSAMPFGQSDAPVNIQSSRLDVNDASKTAVYTGSVVVEQAGATLSAPELTVTYEGAAATTGASSDGGKLKRVIAKTDIQITQSTGEVVNSRTADFDAATQVAVLEGDVVMTQGPDRRATGDHAEFDQKANTITLTGPVTLTQGQNALRGGRLVFNRATSQMQLSAPGAGRIFAKFQQDQAGKPAEAASGATPGARGIPFAATFKTSPGAPVSVESATLDIDDAAKQAVFRGKVRAVQGDFVIQSSELTAAYTGSAGLAGATPAANQGAAQLSKLKARKDVQITSADGQRATGDWADFDTRSNTATLGGDVVLTQGKNVVRGTKLTIDMTTGQTVINTEPGAGAGPLISSSGADGQGQITKSQRPSAIFYPSEIKGQQNGAAKDAAGKGGAAGGWQARSAP